jgi:hypothetical protein
MRILNDSKHETFDFFNLERPKSRVRYFFLSFLVILALRMLENTVHEYAHAAVVLIVGGEVIGMPFVTPFGGFTRWRYVPTSWLPVVNIAGTMASVAVMLGVFLPVYFKSRHAWTRWIGYWGACVVPVNTIFYWFMAPFLANAQYYDPVAFANNVGISPTWIIGAVVAVPFFAATWWMVKATGNMRTSILGDPGKFHAFCLVLYYIMSIGFPVVSYLNLLDRFVFW